MSTETPIKANTAAVIRDGTSHIFYTCSLSANENGILEVFDRNGPYGASEAMVSIKRKRVETIENSPLAATLVADKTQINLYYFAQSTDGAFVREICQKDEEKWIDGSLSEYLVQEGVFPALDSTLTVWADKEDIHLYFKSTTNGPKEFTLAKYVAEESSWQIRKIDFGYKMGIAA